MTVETKINRQARSGPPSPNILLNYMLILEDRIKTIQHHKDIHVARRPVYENKKLNSESLTKVDTMINNSPASYAFIRACIFFLHYLAPLSAVYCVVILLLRPSTYRIPLVLEVWAIAETAFFALIYVPRAVVLQRAATHPDTHPGREQRRKLFKLCLNTVEDPEKYLSGWMRGAPASEIKRENVKGEVQILQPCLHHSKT